MPALHQASSRQMLPLRCWLFVAASFLFTFFLAIIIIFFFPPFHLLPFSNFNFIHSVFSLSLFLSVSPFIYTLSRTHLASFVMGFSLAAFNFQIFFYFLLVFASFCKPYFAVLFSLSLFMELLAGAWLCAFGSFWSSLCICNVGGHVFVSRWSALYF